MMLLLLKVWAPLHSCGAHDHRWPVHLDCGCNSCWNKQHRCRHQDLLFSIPQSYCTIPLQYLFPLTPQCYCTIPLQYLFPLTPQCYCTVPHLFSPTPQSYHYYPYLIPVSPQCYSTPTSFLGPYLPPPSPAYSSHHTHPLFCHGLEASATISFRWRLTEVPD